MMSNPFFDHPILNSPYEYPAVRSCRLFNTALDFVFYDVPTLRAALAEKDAPMQARGEKPPRGSSISMH
jgi:hypothetical protein